MKYLLILSFYHLFIIPVALSTHSFCHPSVSQLFISMIHPLILSLCHTYVSIISLSLYFSVYQISGCGGGRAVYLFVFGFFFQKYIFMSNNLSLISLLSKVHLLWYAAHMDLLHFFLSDFQHFLPPTIKLGQIIIVRNFLRIHQKLLLINIIIIIIILLNMYLTLLTLQNILLHLRC